MLANAKYMVFLLLFEHFQQVISSSYAGKLVSGRTPETLLLLPARLSAFGLGSVAGRGMWGWGVRLYKTP